MNRPISAEGADANGTPLQVSLTGENRHDVTQLLPLVDSLPQIRGVVGRPRRKPRRPYADRGYDYDIYRRKLRARGITPRSPAGAPPTARDSARRGGSSNAASLGCTSSNAYAPATSAAPTYTWASYTSPAPSSAGGNCPASHSQTSSTGPLQDVG
ncbi:hypothetical protein GCM10017772_14850 [Promicromonospora soli]|uniref:Transposase IS4-like domain-containing protein n=1 Tax=Promicromonospora soli TaxID=2035533 RepID=A0A919FPR2_9MICO|nr:hypothetical protein GCM10017772_14850 [Promicromonospora soli]